MVALKRAVGFNYDKSQVVMNLSSLSSDTTCQLDVLWHNSHTLGVNGTQVGVLKQTHQVGLGCFLQSTSVPRGGLGGLKPTPSAVKLAVKARKSGKKPQNFCAFGANLQ